jgi:hypothetical protein
LPFTDAAQTPLVEADKSGYEYQALPGEPKTVILLKRGRKLVVMVNPATRHHPEVQELIHLLRLNPSLPQYDIKVGAQRPYATGEDAAETALHIIPRSTIQALFYMSRGVMVPPDHLRQGIAKATVGPDGQVFDWPQVTEGLFRVHSCKQFCRPKDAEVAVKYRGYWFYIDVRDHESKATFALMQQLVRLDLGHRPLGGPLNAPVLTLPVGR